MPQFANNPTESQWLQRLQRVLGNGTKQLVNKIFFRLPDSYVPIFQAMAEDFYLKGKIPAPSIGLLAKYCLIMAGNAWNKDFFQLENKENEVDYTRLPRKPWHPHAPALQSTMKLCDWRYAVAAAYEADEEWSSAEAAARMADAEISPEDF